MATARRTSLRDINRERVLALVRKSGGTSRAEIARATGLSRPTVSGIVSELLGAGLLARSGRRNHPERGRPAELVEAAPATGVALAVDVGRSHVRVLVADSVGRLLVERTRSAGRRRPTAKQLTLAGVLVAESMEVVRAHGLELVGAVVGVPSPVDPAGRPVSGDLRDIDLAGTIGLRTVTDVVHVRNDADLGAVGEVVFGAGRGLSNVVRVVVSHGVGAGVVLGGALYRGGGFAGDIGHVRVANAGRACVCGNVGCLETVASVDALTGALQPVHPDRVVDVVALAELATAGDRAATTVLYEAGMVVGRTLAQLVAFLSPEAVLVDGLPGAAGEHLFRGVNDAVARFGSSGTTRSLLVAPGELGQRSQALGGVALAFGRVSEVVVSGRTDLPAGSGGIR
ncbi:putative NBD/HSP70 family sugar kinase [Promicromonospora sp. AC04]|uniref:ROK family transcriptional regulator n=1 Tax=Promicromonospora sp. AC04 TaxID=2135723 RepID=UPI000D45A5C9|nr:ROK family transcriptional regulator [Promicromonospora sp. AC04]PUB32303.1 putative NBD/HSP70 family sugar kinase [Promicromonospora sp. AC04]